MMNMKNLVRRMTGRLTAWTGIALVTVLLAGCLDDDTTQVTPVPVGYVSIYHASPDAPPLDVLVDNRQLSSRPFVYSDHSNYVNFYTGDRNLKFNTANASSALVDTTFNVADGKAYSVFVINTLSSGLESLIIADSSAAPETGKAMVRFVNLSPDAPAFDILSNNTDKVFENTAFKGATTYKQVDAGTYSFDVTPSGTQNKSVSAKDIRFVPGRYYTIIVRGFVTPPAGNSNVLSIEVI